MGISVWKVCLLAAALIQPLLCQNGKRIIVGPSIFGRVETEDGKPVAGVMISAMRYAFPDSLAVAPPVESALSGLDGGFRLSGLTFGRYRLCAHLAFSDLLGPCEWETSSTELSLNTEDVRTGVVIRMMKGQLVTVRVVDPGGYLDKNLGKTRGSAMAVGYRKENGPFEVKVPAMKDGVGREYRFAVPFDIRVQVGVISNGFQLEDSGGKALTASHEVDVQMARPVGSAATQVPVGSVVLIQVKGVKP